MTKDKEAYFPQPDRWSYLWLALGTLCMIFIGGSWLLPMAGWLASVFMLRFIRTQKLWRGYLLVVIGLSVANSIGWSIQNPTSFPAPVFGTVTGLFFSLAFLIDRVLVPHTRAEGKVPFTATLIFPLVTTASQFLFFNKFLFGSYGTWAYSQHGSLILKQLVSITGVWGLLFLMGWFASVINWAWEREFIWSDTRRGVLVFGGVLLLVLAYGSIRMTFAPLEAETVRVHSFTTEEAFGNKLITDEMIPLAQSDLTAFRSRTADINERIIQGSIREAKAGAQIVVWPEAAAIGIKEDIDALIAQGQAVASAENIYLAMGLLTINPNKDIDPRDTIELRLVVVDPSGEVVLNHLKYAYGLGDPLSQVELQTVDTPYGRLSGILCGDMDIPGVVKQVGHKGADILLIPSQETKPADSPWHVLFTSFRAIENGVSVVRPTAGGISIATDPYGRTLASMDHASTEERVMVAHVPIHRVGTIYSMVGDLFGWLTVAGFVVITGWVILKGRYSRSKEVISPEVQVPTE